MRVALITGALGFVGRNLTDKLLKSGYKIIAIDRVDSSLVNVAKNVTYIQSALDDWKAFPMLDVKCDILYHLAWAGVNPDARGDIDIQKGNIDICINAVNIAKKLSIPRVVFVGSTMEYCYNKEAISEHSLPTPSNAYGSVKVATRFICSELCLSYGIDFEYAVVTSIYGKGREDNNVVFYTIKKLLDNESPDLTECIQKWDFIHIDDVTNALKLIGERGVAQAFYAVGTGENKVLREYIDVICSMIGKNSYVNFGAVEYKNGVMAQSAIDISRLKNDTGYHPTYHFEEGIIEVIDFYRSKK